MAVMKRMLRQAIPVTLWVVLVVGAVSMVSVRWMTARELTAAKDKARRVESELREIGSERYAVAERLHSLVTNTSAVELEIRQHLRMVKPGERLVLVEREP